VNKTLKNHKSTPQRRKDRDSIQEKLIRKKIDDSDDINILKMIQKLDPELLKNKLTDNELMTQTLYEEIKKQNEILKLILRRASMAAGFSRQTAPEKSIEHDIVKQVNQEVAEIKI
jgi:hypothetical protein